jgi:hypothetical protein
VISLAAIDRRQPARLLLGVPGVQQVRARHVGVHQHRDDEAAEGRADSASWNTTLVSVSASAPPYSAGAVRPSQPARPSSSQHIARRVALFVPGERVRLDLLRDETRDLPAQLDVFGWV